jgi:transcriptional regulator with PAS, ATPase and Fis domain
MWAGAFTGADRNKKGLIEAAEGGTPISRRDRRPAPPIQLKPLRFLETRREYGMVGDPIGRQAMSASLRQPTEN